VAAGGHPEAAGTSATLVRREYPLNGLESDMEQPLPEARVTIAALRFERA
jgi:hypothetical protein